MKTAFISDIHANIEALQAVLADIEPRGVDRIMCLGDVVNYGPDPAACLKIIRRLDLSLMGNHEEAVLHMPIGFNPVAAEAAVWTRSVLEPGVRASAEKKANWAFMEGRPLRHEEDGVLLVHASPREPTSEYLLPSDVDPLLGEMSDKLAGCFEMVERACFVGHTHVPGVFTEGGEFLSPEEIEGEYRLQIGTKIICNVGSVGQPRDRNRDACYAVFDGELIAFHRVAYDAETTCEKVKGAKGLPDWCGTRLLKGE
jgi:diadenosine tetraphosphatase ApaH/serine/threonine PP2A family protein phosphatase